MLQNANLDFGLGPDLDMLRDQVRSFAADKIAPRAEEIDKTDQFPQDLWPQMGELGLHGITVEEEHGGAGLGYLAHCIAMEEISRASASVGLSYLLRDAKLYEIGAGTSEIRRMLIGRELFQGN
jgi:isovaleryl-CoA dehydrogenase